jgi:hypothetical protein
MRIEDLTRIKDPYKDRGSLQGPRILTKFKDSYTPVSRILMKIKDPYDED